LALNFDEKPVEKWNTRDFLRYLEDKHMKRFGIPYRPQGGWQREAGMIGDAIGTQKKPAKYDKATIKRFIDLCIEGYSPTKAYPGINFSFMWTYRSNDLQRAILETKREQAAIEDDNLDELEDFL